MESIPKKNKFQLETEAIFARMQAKLTPEQRKERENWPGHTYTPTVRVPEPPKTFHPQPQSQPQRPPYSKPVAQQAQGHAPRYRAVPQQPLTDTGDIKLSDIEPDGKAKPWKFDQETYNKISGLDARLLELIDYDSRQTQKISPNRSKYSTKPQAYWAKILGVTRETINEHIQHLTKLGILDVTNRRKVGGKWQTNITRIVGWVWWRLGKILRNLRKRPHRVTKGSHIATPVRENKTFSEPEAKIGRKFTSQILDRWMQRGKV